MSKGATIPERLEAVRKELDKEQDRWEKAKLPGPKALYEMGEQQFMHHCHLQALSKLVEEKLGLSEDEIELAIAEMFLSETKDMFDRAVKMRRDLRRQAIVKGL